MKCSQAFQFFILVYRARAWFVADVYLLSTYCECTDCYFNQILSMHAMKMETFPNPNSIWSRAIWISKGPLYM